MKKFFVRFLIALLVLQSAVVGTLLNLKTVKAAGTPEVVINEVMWMGSTASTADEWIELRNTTSSLIDISGWKLTNSATSGGTLVIPDGKSISANGYFLIANYDKTELNSVLDVTADWVTTTVSLSNTCNQIDLTMADLTPVDSMGCSGGNYYHTTSTVKYALERNITIADGTLETSWHERDDGYANLDVSAVAAGNLATPKVANDTTSPVASTLPRDTDGINNASDIDYTVSQTAVYGAWDIFDDAVTKYEVSFADSAIGPFTTWQDFASMSFGSLTAALIAGNTYYIAVKAINEVNLTSLVYVSDGAANVAPEPPTTFTAVDEPSDNGGVIRLNWVASTSIDLANYSIEYQKVGDPTSTILLIGPADTVLVTGLENNPAAYTFSIKAIDLSGLESTVVGPTSLISALDNIAPSLNTAKIQVGQNRPGVADSISGTIGAVSESSTVNVFDRDPTIPGTLPIGSIDSNSDGSFSAQTVGDNKTAVIFVQLIDKDAGVPPSPIYQFQNDIVGPTASTINSLTSRCESNACRVNLTWSGSNDSVTYKVSYKTEGVETKTFEVSSNSMTLDLPSGKIYEFAVYAYDQFGNESSKSNVFTIALVKGVITTATWSNGAQVTKTEAIAGTPEVIETPKPTSTKLETIVPKAKAAEPQAETPAEKPLVQTSSNSDWVRILVIAIILVIIAGSFYGLSRTLQPTPEEEFDNKEMKKPTKSNGRKSQRRPKRR